jgi:dTDP-4-amino-4,6-dideoxygalactose transaminase
MSPPIRVPLLDLPKAHESLSPELREVFDRVLKSGRFIFGPEVEGFEAECASYLGVDHAIAVSSGTDALLAALMAVGVGPGDEVICPTFSFFATAGCIARLGAEPVFADVDESSFNSRREDFESLVGERTRALVIVHLYGRCADIDPLLELARERGVPVIEDAAQALGATSEGRAAGSMGEIGCFSFFPTKNLGAFGDAGLVVTKDEALGERLRATRNHGEASKYHHSFVGGNFRMDALQAALLRVKLPHLDTYNEARRRNAQRYEQLFAATGVAGLVGQTTDPEPSILLTPASWPGHIFHQYVIQVLGDGLRDRLREYLAENGVQTEVYYPQALHRQACFAELARPRPTLPVAERLARQVLALPVHPDLDDEQLRYVVDSIAGFFASPS